MNHIAKDPVLIEHLNQMLEESSFDGSWKLTSNEMTSLAECLNEFALETYTRGYDSGYDDCMETFQQEAESLFIKE